MVIIFYVRLKLIIKKTTLMRRRITENVKEYINKLKFKMIFDDGKPGQVYFLDVANHTIILFFVDIPDKCIYINQDIIDELGETNIDDFLKSFDIHYSIFPYFNEGLELIPSDNKWFKELMEDITNLSIGYEIALSTDGYLLPYEYRIKENELWVDHYGMYGENDYLIKDTIKDFFKMDIFIDYYD